MQVQAIAALPDPKTVEDKLRAIIGGLESTANDRVQRRKHIEERWLKDLRQYYGRYDPDIEAALKDSSASRLFVNLTRAKTNAMSARLMDLLFPTDDQNWGIQPTPVPELTQEAEAAIEQAKAATQQATEAQAAGNPMASQMAQQAEQAQSHADQIQEIIYKARLRAEAMQREIDDILKECGYEAANRDAIESACKVGTGVIKGPVVGDRVRRNWVSNEDGTYQLVMGGEAERPGFQHVDVWSFFPDPDARSIEESEGVFIRHLMKERQLRSLAKMPSFSPDAIRRILSSKAKDSAPQYLLDLRTIMGDQDAQLTHPHWHVWEYTGPLSADAMTLLAQVFGDEETAAEMSEIDPLDEVNAVVWFCQGEVLKFALYPMDSGEPIFSVFNLEADESSVFGYGIPSIMRGDQGALNAAWRMMMDNGGLGTGPQIVVNKEQIEPADGKWEMRPRKIWYRKESSVSKAPAFETYHVNMHQVELANIIAMSKQQIDEVTSLPQIAQGEQGTGVTRTAQGMALLMNSANVIFRRVVKNYDDHFTVPNIRRLYDWLMQFSPKEAIKGDFEVDARGSSVLLVREMQAQNLLALSQYADHPVYGPAVRKMELLREVFRAHMLPHDRFILSDSEYEAEVARLMEQAQAASAQEPDPMAQAKIEIEGKKLELAEMELQLKAEIANAENDTRLKLEKMRYDTAMMKLAEDLNISVDKVRAQMDNADADRRSKERIFAAEASMTERHGKGGGGYL